MPDARRADAARGRSHRLPVRLREARLQGRGGDGFADVWKRDFFAWEYKGKNKDRDYRSLDEIDGLRQQFRRHVDLVAILRRKELENYLLEVGPLTRAIARRVRDRQRRTGTGRAITESAVAAQLEEVEVGLKEEAEAQAIARRIQFLRPGGVNETTATKQAMAEFRSQWTQTDGPAALVPGKVALARLNGWAQADLDVSVSPGQIASEFHPDEIPVEVKAFLRQLSELKRAPD